MKMEFQLPDLPTFNSVEEERQEVKKKLAASFRLFSKVGFPIFFVFFFEVFIVVGVLVLIEKFL